MNRVQVLLQTPSARVAVFDHPPDEAHVDPAEEVAGMDAIAFVEAGTFAIRPHGAAEAWEFAPGLLFVSARGLAFRCRHGEECPGDRCLSVAYTPAGVDDLRTAGLPALRAGAVRGGAPSSTTRCAPRCWRGRCTSRCSTRGRRRAASRPR
ncbi:hypothetical protein [Roseisolibacter sp. H3M3-2]|uniref:hypothetical protein n=1 Tax=Roseisolibacter sp. H3M3-2 TaxID=3031323 RepID=UPI0023DBE5DA|nr:hypothetical protein [Roseisolibacter sp. H3M3-2]MDF1505538.1 hypothetical protein [Roseisolibacter sp. H3M3-2]